MASALPALRRSLLYVPATRSKFLESAFKRPTDNITFDLEDSVTTSLKEEARSRLQTFISGIEPRPAPSSKTRRPEVAVRINDMSTRWAIPDLEAFVGSPNIDTIVVPKVNSPSDLHTVAQVVQQTAPHRLTGAPDPNAPDQLAPPRLKILALIESARAVMDLRSITSAYDVSSSTYSATPQLAGLIFAAEDFALDMGLTRSAGLTEMLYARSAVVTAAKAAGLESALDLVCTSYGSDQGQRALAGECAGGRAMGFTGKQCIHPTQLYMVNRSFGPSKQAVEWAVRVLIADRVAVERGLGAWSLDGSMIDAPVVGKARRTVEMAEQCGFDVEELREKFRDQQPT